MGLRFSGSVVEKDFWVLILDFMLAQKRVQWYTARAGRQQTGVNYGKENNAHVGHESFTRGVGFRVLVSPVQHALLNSLPPNS